MRLPLIAVAVAGAVSGCIETGTPRSVPDPRLQALVSQPMGDFLAEARVASLLAQGCPAVAMTPELFNALVIARETSRTDGPPFDRDAVVRAAQAAFASRTADLRSRHSGDPFRRGTCTVIAAESARGLPATAFLSPVPREG